MSSPLTLENLRLSSAQPVSATAVQTTRAATAARTFLRECVRFLFIRAYPISSGSVDVVWQ